MNTNILPTDELKKYGIINEDNTFSTKINSEDIQKFLQGYTIVADHDKNRATFQLTDSNTKLKVIFLERDKSISEILKNSTNGIQYSQIKNLSKSASELNFEQKAFVFDKEANKVVEFDLIKNCRELTAIIADKRDAGELDRYKTELLRLKSFLQDKIEQFPEMTNEIANDMNIVSKEIATVDGICEKPNHSERQVHPDIQLNVNDPDMYQDASRVRDEKQEQDLDGQKSKGLRR